MTSYWIECNACDASYTADYDTDGFRWMEKHAETHEPITAAENDDPLQDAGDR